MNKQEFLNELQSRIRILEEAEQQDILAEYAQHIDLRTAGGLSEEEAIRDFGNPEELAAEILEAYHVDPARVEAPPSHPLAGVSSGLKRTAGRCRRFLGRIGGGLRSLASRIAAWWGSLGQRLRGLRRSPAPRPAADAEKAPSPVSRFRRIRTGAALGLRGLGRRIRTGASLGVRGLGRLIKALVRLAWNLLLLLIALPFVVTAVLAILSIGVLAVLLIQGYPLAGPLLCCLGLALCCIALVGLGTTLVWKRRNAAPSYEVPQDPSAPTPSQSLAPVETHSEEVSIHA